jgi:alginate O-acetyltransferase complex protein AlgI
MIFTSWPFALFFCVFYAVLLPLRTRWQRLVLVLLGSITFYALWDYRFVPVILAPGLVDYWCAIRIEESERHRKAWLACSIAFNLLLLGYFKYTNFLIDTVASVLGIEPLHLSIILPVGISFFTFKTMSYTIDVYRGELEACRSLRKYLTFIFYFPELIAGPIVRASVLLPQLSRSLRPSGRRFLLGTQIVLLGVTKKLLLADRLAVFVDGVFAHPGQFDSLTLSLAVLAYALQVYCDFSGYSDIAIGISKIIGLDLPENFNMPYLATSLSEFWRRWHMTLSSWLRDYLYIPLGGNRHGRWLTYRNLMLTMLLGGLWHGANWTFVIWGGLHGLFLVIQRLWVRFVPLKDRVPAVFYWTVTFLGVNLAWIFFRAPNLPTAWLIVTRIATLNAAGFRWIYEPLLLLLPLVIVAHYIGIRAARAAGGDSLVARARSVFAGVETVEAVRPHRAAGIYAILQLETFMGAFTVTAWLLVLALFCELKSSPFIYFQF